MPLLWVFRDALGMTGTKFGCGIAFCGACTVHLDGARCGLPVPVGGGRARSPPSRAFPARPPALKQKAWPDLEVPQCGYCQPGQIMSAIRAADANPEPADAAIDAAMAGNLCRCGTYVRIREGIKHAARSDAPLTADAGISRRALVGGGAALIGGLSIGIELPSTAACADEPVPTGARFNAFIHIAPDDSVTFTLPAVEMGQGVYTSQAQCIAEELDIGLDKVIAAAAPPDQADYGSPVFIVQATGGSTTTMAWTGPLRKAGAAARAMLVRAAAVEWGVDASGLTMENGVITDKAGGRAIRYGAVADQAAQLQPPAGVKLKDPARFRLIGKPIHRIDTPDKATGKTVYGIDVMRPGMKFATLMASPCSAARSARSISRRRSPFPAFGRWWCSMISSRWLATTHGRRCKDWARSRSNGRPASMRASIKPSSGWISRRHPKVREWSREKRATRWPS